MGLVFKSARAPPAAGLEELRQRAPAGRPSSNSPQRCNMRTFGPGKSLHRNAVTPAAESPIPSHGASLHSGAPPREDVEFSSSEPCTFAWRPRALSSLSATSSATAANLACSRARQQTTRRSVALSRLTVTSILSSHVTALEFIDPPRRIAKRAAKFVERPGWPEGCAVTNIVVSPRGRSLTAKLYRPSASACALIASCPDSNVASMVAPGEDWPFTWSASGSTGPAVEGGNELGGV